MVAPIKLAESGQLLLKMATRLIKVGKPTKEPFVFKKIDKRLAENGHYEKWQRQLVSCLYCGVDW